MHKKNLCGWMNNRMKRTACPCMLPRGFVFESENLAKTNDWQKSANYISLNGDWKFKWVEKPADLPAHFEAVNFDDHDWKNFKVPANWEVNGYGYPIYVNIGYSFQDRMKPDPPIVPLDFDPTGVYRREIRNRR